MENFNLSRTYDFLPKQVDEYDRFIRTYQNYNRTGYIAEMVVFLESRTLKVRTEITNELIEKSIGDIERFVLGKLCNKLIKEISEDNNLWIRPSI